MISLGSRLIVCCKLAPTLARQMWRHNYVIDRNEYLIFTLSESINPWVYSLQFLFKSTNNSWRYERKCEWVFFFWTQCIMLATYTTNCLSRMSMVRHRMLMYTKMLTGSQLRKCVFAMEISTLNFITYCYFYFFKFLFYRLI